MVRNVTEAAASQTPAPPASPAPSTPPAKERTGGGAAAATSPLPASRTASVSMGVTAAARRRAKTGAQNPSGIPVNLAQGTSAFPCCGKNSVDIVERPNDHYHYPHPQEEKEEDDAELKTELPKKETLSKEDPDPDLGPVPQLEEMEPDVPTEPTSEAEGDCFTENPEQQSYRIESLKPYKEDLPPMHKFRPWSFNANSSNREEDQVSTQYRSIRVQTSKHLFWANKLIQASEHSLQQALKIQCNKSSLEQKSVPTGQLLPSKSPVPPRSHRSCPSLPATIGLAELINFASSLAIASSSNMDLPNLEDMIKDPPENAKEPSIALVQHAQAARLAQPALKKQELPEKLPKAVETRQPWTQETQNFPCSYLDFSKTGLKKATIEGEVNFLQAPALSPQLQGAKEEQQRPEDQEISIDTEKKPRSLLTRDSREDQASRIQKERQQLYTVQLTQSELAAATATRDEQTIRRAREFKDPAVTHLTWPGPDVRSQSNLTDDSLLPLTPRQLAAFQDIFKLFSCSPTGTVDMHSMKVALRNVGIQLGPQEMCEALRLADLDGDGIVSFKDFLGVLTDNNRLEQCMGQMKSHRLHDPPGLQTLFLEVLFKLLSQGFVPSKSGQEVTSYYFKKQRALRLSPGCKGRARGQGRPTRGYTGLNYFCQAARLSGLSSTQLARSLHTMYKAGGRSPYAQIPNLTGRLRPERRIQTRAPGHDVRLPKPQQPSRPKLPPNLGPLCKGPLRPPAGLVNQPLEQMRPSKLAPSPPTLVQKHPSSPSPACFQRSAVKSLYK